MILIADSGSTKTDWVLTGEESLTIQTQGISPVHQDEAVIRRILFDELLPQLAQRQHVVETVCFYGSGCTPQHIPMVERLLRVAFPKATHIEVQSDLVGAARALCGRREGIACILGTGANSCLWDGGRIVQNTPALGYILGDEGSGAVLGRMFMNAIFKNPELSALRDLYLSENGLTMADIINKVYRQPMANRFLASTSLFISQHLDVEELRLLVVDNFRRFFRCNIVPYGRYGLPVHFVGSMAHHYAEQLREAAAAEGFRVGIIEKSPLSGLLHYHSAG